MSGVGSPAGSRSVAGGGRDAVGVVARPGLFGRLEGPARVTVVSAPAGSGKSVLLRSWMAGAGLVRAVSAAPDLDGWGAG
jgi:LuxR family transcriptional regulator, maltose regulon positive regulatory protein